MAQKRTTVEAKQSVHKQAAMKYSVEKLRENCRRLFGVSSSAFAGATYGMEGKYTVEEMKAHIEAWMKKEAK